MIKWDDLFKAETSVELFILLGDAFSDLSGNPEVKIDRIDEGNRRGLQMEVSQSISVFHEDGCHLCRPVTQEFILLQDGTLIWEMKLTGEKVIGQLDIQARLRQVMEDNQEFLLFSDVLDSSQIAKTTGSIPVRDEERVLVGYTPKSTKPTLEMILPRQEKGLSNERTGRLEA